MRTRLAAAATVLALFAGGAAANAGGLMHKPAIVSAPIISRHLIDLTTSTYTGPNHAGPRTITGGSAVDVMHEDWRPGDLVGIDNGDQWSDWYIVNWVVREQIPAASSRTFLPLDGVSLKMAESWNDGTRLLIRVQLERIYCDTCG